MNSSEEILPHAIKVLKDAGYKLVTLSECIGQEPYRFTNPPAERDVSSTMHPLLNTSSGLIGTSCRTPGLAKASPCPEYKQRLDSLTQSSGRYIVEPGLFKIGSPGCMLLGFYFAADWTSTHVPLDCSHVLDNSPLL